MTLASLPQGWTSAATTGWVPTGGSNEPHDLRSTAASASTSGTVVSVLGLGLTFACD